MQISFSLNALDIFAIIILYGLHLIYSTLGKQVFAHVLIAKIAALLRLDNVIKNEELALINKIIEKIVNGGTTANQNRPTTPDSAATNNEEERHAAQAPGVTGFRYLPLAFELNQLATQELAGSQHGNRRTGNNATDTVSIKTNAPTTGPEYHVISPILSNSGPQTTVRNVYTDDTVFLILYD